MRSFLLFPVCLLLLTACVKNTDVRTKENADQKENIQGVIDIDEKTIDEALDILENNLNVIESEKIKLEQQIDSKAKSALQVVDECIDSQESKGLPIYECTNLLKP